MKIISPSSNVLDLCVYMSSNCTFDFHVANVCYTWLTLTGFAPNLQVKINMLRINLTYESQLFANKRYILMYQTMIGQPFRTF